MIQVTIPEMQGPWKTKLPMYLTYSRAAAAPVILGVLMSGWNSAGWVSAGLFVVAAMTDWWDGMLARRFGVGAIVMLLAMGRVDPVMVFLFLARDIFIGGIRSVAAADNLIIAAKPFGKWKTAIQMLAIPCLLIYEPVFGIPVADVGYYGLWVSVGLSLISGAEYTIGYYRGVK